VRTMAGTPGISWVLIDAEHGQINDTHIFTHTTLVAAAHRSPIVRIPAAADWWIKRALDSGAHGIMAPLLKTASEVRAVVSASRYPPKGTRGFGPMYTHHAFGTGPEHQVCTAQEYRAGADDVLVVVQIENREAVENLEEIANVDGLDVLFIGPFDLSLSLGVQFGSPEHESAISKVLEVAHKYGKKAAFYCTNGEQAKARAAQGFDMISIATDVDVLSLGFTAHMASATGTNIGGPGSGYST